MAPPPGSWCSGRWRPSLQQTQAQLEVNLFGALAVTRAFLPQMRQRGSGRIVNVSSVMGRFALPGSGHVRRTQSLEGKHMHRLNVLISGASIAGPALAYWLHRYGHTVTVVEKAAALRPGGQAVDFKGDTHRQVLERMGILDEVQRRQTGKTDMVIVDDHSRPLATIPGEFTGGDVEILRGDLATLLYDRTSGDSEYRFGDSITTLTQSGSSVEVAFQQAAPRTFDLVIGADGIHSNVRRLAFGPEERFVRFLGYYYAVAGGWGADAATAPSTQRGKGLMYNLPGRLAWVGGPKAPNMYVFASQQLDYDRNDVAQQKRIVADAFAGVGWQVPRMLSRLADAPEFYLDSISRTDLDHYTTGRVALIGDAAYGNTLGGFGTGLALVGAYVLAGELAAAGGDHHLAFARYNHQMHQYAKIARKGSAGPFLAPPTPARIRLRNWTFRFSVPLRLMMTVTNRYATDIDLRDYPQEVKHSADAPKGGSRASAAEGGGRDAR